MAGIYDSLEMEKTFGRTLYRSRAGKSNDKIFSHFPSRWIGRKLPALFGKVDRHNGWLRAFLLTYEAKLQSRSI